MGALITCWQEYIYLSIDIDIDIDSMTLFVTATDEQMPQKSHC